MKFELVELNNTNYSFVRLQHREQDYFHFHRTAKIMNSNKILIFSSCFTLTRNPFRGLAVSLSSETNRPSNGPIIVVFKIRTVGENVIVSSQRRICICVGSESRTLIIQIDTLLNKKTKTIILLGQIFR